MQGHIEQITIEQAIKTAKRVFVDSVKEEYENSLPNAAITVYIKNPEIDEKGARSGFMFNISDDTVTEEELEHQLRSRQESLTQRFLDKAAAHPNSKRNPDVNNRIKFLGLILETEWDISQTESTELSEVDKSEFRKAVVPSFGFRLRCAENCTIFIAKINSVSKKEKKCTRK